MHWLEASPMFLSNPKYVGDNSYSSMVAPLLTHEIKNAYHMRSMFSY